MTTMEIAANMGGAVSGEITAASALPKVVQGVSELTGKAVEMFWRVPKP
jgi:hypothetical protein